MLPQRRRAILKTAATSLPFFLAAGCVSTDPGQSGTNQTDEVQTSSPGITSTQSRSRDYGPWSVTVDNNLEEESTVTIRILTLDGDLYKKEEVRVAVGDGINALTVTESGTYILKASTAFDSGSTEFNACKLNSDAIVELYTDDDEPQLTISQRHTDPGASTTVDDPYSCE